MWLVRALGYADIAELSQGLTIPFTDVSGDRGYIAVAYDIGMTNGVTPTTFAPEATATREQVAAMLVRVYERYIGRTAFTHAFYAISSYSQLELAKRFDAVSFGWGRMELTGEKVRLNTTADNGNEFCVPAGYEGVVRALRDAGVKLHLSVFMDTAGGLADLLADPDLRTAAVDAILAELTTPYKKLGDRPYTGVTLDFEGLRSAQKAGYTAFLRELDTRLEREGLTLYVSVQPATADGVYYDGYDYRAIGELADKVILMAHDYSPRSMEGFVGTTYYKNAALTPIRSVYCSLRAVCDPATGVQDRSKLVLAISCTGAAWEIDGKGLLVSPDPVYPSMETIYSRMVEGGRRGWSQDDRSPHMQYAAGDGRYYDLWYEDERSVSAKIDLAQMFGVSGVSFWRLGTIPNYPDDDLQFDVMRAIN